jgi:hypothetical protein
MYGYFQEDDTFISACRPADDDKPAFLLHSRCKFGTLFAESLPGAGCRAATEGEGVGVVEPIQHGY